jgi:hypothetical protein
MFQVGDKVECIEIQDGNTYILNKTGTVKHINGTWCYVEFDFEFKGGHSCDRFCKAGHGWSIAPQRLRLADEPSIDFDYEEFNEIMF